MHLRAAFENDLAGIISWISDADECKLWAGPSVTFPLSVDSLKAQIVYTPENSFCLEKEEQVIAFGQLIRKGEQRLHLARIIVDPSERGKGCGRILCGQLIAKASVLQCRWVTLNVYKNNAAAMKLYKRLGFEEKQPPAEEKVSDDICFMAMLMQSK